ncbi:cAMP-regulated phosphoprotein/endosulfine conserved region domain-containing protein [Ditylenchus destructor]|nr:cAMP-regulated phosphoprotein/endosulfine conserved region domain-containing protein [Ditylenchus destructor]
MRGELRSQEKDLKKEGDAEGVVSAQLDTGKDDPSSDDAVSVEKQQEILLINKMAAGGKLPPKNQSMFLQKKLQQRKFFDSGDYAMNQNKEKKIHPVPIPAVPQIAPPPCAAVERTDPKSPTNVIAEETVSQPLPTLRPPPMSSLTVSGSSMDAGDSDEESQLQIPRPDTVPQRKASILHPSAHSKLSPQPHIHHDHNDESITAAPQ